MHIDPQLVEFLVTCSAVRSESELEEVLGLATRRMGFEQFALNHHVDLVGPPEDAIVLLNYKPAWIDRALSNGYHLDDPVHAASEKASFGFYWRDLSDLVPISKRHQLILDEARGYGLCDGFTVPVHVPGEYRGTCSFGARRVAVTPNLTACAQLVGLFAFECARRLVHARRSGSSPSIPKLTRRQRDCLPFVAAGKSDGVIGQLLGLAPSTVHQHVTDAMERYGVATRMQLVVRALFDSQIVYNAAFRL